MSRRAVLTSAVFAAALTAVIVALAPIGAGASEKLPPEPTKLTLTSSASTVNQGGSTVVRGSLVTSDTTAPIVGADVVLERSLDASAHWSRVATLTTDASGTCVTTCTLTQNTRFRARYPGDGLSYEPAYSNGANVWCRAAIYTPVLSPSAPRVNRTITISGLVRPRHTSSMTMYLYQAYGGHYVRRRMRAVVLRPIAGTGYSKWTYVTTASGTGWWLVRARHRDATHSDTYRDRAFIVRP